ncbi:lipase family protein [Nocardia spumae]|uniref:lipase family protein n=1 Tax=Nocardia spumae TaxID=2887190 RepID=UPI001D156DA7|nr:lipase family protein [Nocardia spumae]
MTDPVAGADTPIVRSLIPWSRTRLPVLSTFDCLSKACIKIRKDSIVRSRIRSWALVILIFAASGAIYAPHAWAQPPAQAAAGDFYVPPPLPPVPPGAILRTEPAALALSAPGQPGVMPARSTKMMYVSSDTHDAPTAVVATYLEPILPWTGPGERPLVAYGVGSQGQGDQCAPSKVLPQIAQFRPPYDALAEYDLIALSSLLARGMAVVVTDYHGLGTPDVHDFLNRKAQAYAVLDSARAALQMPGSGLNPHSPIMLFGYSQGGMASAGAAELQSSYAPELNVRGAYVGGPIVDPENFIGYNYGRPGVGSAAPLTLNGIVADYPETRPILDAEINDVGKGLMNDALGKCAIAASLDIQIRQISHITTSGEPLTAVIDRSPALKEAFDEQRIGSQAPSMPVLIASAMNDEGTPYPPVRAVAAGWCAGGTPVQLDANTQLPAITGIVGTHDLAYFPSLATAQAWMTDRLAGLPAPSNCAALP